MRSGGLSLLRCVLSHVDVPNFTKVKVPTICIENVYVYNNTTVVADEILAQRLGLIPLNVDPKEMSMKVDDESTDRNTIVFTLKLECTRKKNAPKDSTVPSELYENYELLSGHLVWQPAGEQADVFSKNHPAPTNPNIVLAKLRPGQGVEVTLHAVKGVGKDHAKFSPVGEFLVPVVLYGVLMVCSHGLVSPSTKHSHKKTYPASSCRKISKMLLARRHPRRSSNKGCHRR
jgi:hypothetical protein